LPGSHFQADAVQITNQNLESAMTLQLGVENFDETIASDQPVLVDFYTPT